ncbi:putative GAF sensor protein [Hymenobacter roseosalivarius DSM 11622]|uniref:Putative GAF sensor protein n=1 Tax=Hymenobacter roseosalivarius DSM 11622 TaxID=645990 RepID=A0A1W1UZ03_9BACT|nr:GAF domain-containing protein [Hymenobacter roseosalivarius]SMB86240.1 putative GAF sensor protein [Hymenobacter roseosalivarius DSM 11622]
MTLSTSSSHVPANEPQRLEALAPYLVLGTAPDAVFDEVVRLTAKLFNAPIALVSLVEEGSVWFKANFGLAGAERVARNESMCSVAILQDGTTIYEDLLQAPCQLTKPDVAEALQLRFYAGHPLRSADGHHIGTLCVIDRQPRTLSITEQLRLQALAAVVMKLLDLRLALKPHPTHSRALWLQLYHHLDESLTRLNTLAELARWEESVHTTDALKYQQSIEDEADLITQILDKQISAAMATVLALDESEKAT